VIDSPQTLVAMLPKLAPRVYSIASSAKAHPGEVHLTVAAVRYQSHGRARLGIGSTFLADRAAAAPFGVYVQRAHRFRLPKDGAASIIMVGPGTGIAPFRAFLEERRASGARGKSWLFFGDRRAATDYLYRDELDAFRADGTLTRLDTAFSRNQKDKIYVQHRMQESAAELWRWLKDGAHFYVCGDATHMAKDVDRALKSIVARQGRMSDARRSSRSSN
jgi:sulfite reductase (NADPH) flavoprotein alpha-component